MRVGLRAAADRLKISGGRRLSHQSAHDPCDTGLMASSFLHHHQRRYSLNKITALNPNFAACTWTTASGGIRRAIRARGAHRASRRKPGLLQPCRPSR
jgi:hypothetical protein